MAWPTSPSGPRTPLHWKTADGVAFVADDEAFGLAATFGFVAVAFGLGAGAGGAVYGVTPG